MTEWKPIETAPKDGTTIMAWVDNHQYKGPIAIKWYRSRNCWFSLPYDAWLEENILGWLPLLQPPKKKHSCGGKPIRVEQVGDDLILYHYDHCGNERTRIINYCPFCGEKNEYATFKVEVDSKS